jgi:hypothetical protein
MEGDINITGSCTLLVLEQLNCYEIPSSGAVAAVNNGNVLVCKP